MSKSKVKLVIPKTKVRIGDRVTLYNADCIETLKKLEANSIDCCVTDPPYMISFMGRSWDSAKAVEKTAKSAGGFGKDSATNENAYAAARVRYKNESLAMEEFHYQWAKEVYRVLKPGGYLLSMGGSRTHHRLMSGIENAGFEIRDCITWHMGSGFPKSHNISKAIDKMAGAKREVVGVSKRHGGGATVFENQGAAKWATNLKPDLTAPATDDAKKWEGWGSALKPATEYIVQARKPLSEKSLAANVLKWGTGGLNIDACRIGTPENKPYPTSRRYSPGQMAGGCGDYGGNTIQVLHDGMGRWPSNLILSHADGCERTDRVVSKGSKPNPNIQYGKGKSKDTNLVYGKGLDVDIPNVAPYQDIITVWNCVPGCPVAELDRQSGKSKSNLRPAGSGRQDSPKNTWGLNRAIDIERGHSDSGGASRFFLVIEPETPLFYCPKPSKSERDSHCSGIDEKAWVQWQTANNTSGKASNWSKDRQTVKKNTHATVKPLKLMRYLIRLVCPPGGTVLEPFLGSGTTALAALEEGMSVIGMEKDTEHGYFNLARTRLENWTIADEQKRRVRLLLRSGRKVSK